MIRPQPLRVGDKVAIVSPAGALQQPEILRVAADGLTAWGLKVIIAPHASTRDGYFAGSVEERAADFLAMLRDDSIKAIFCSYGGYGCVHLLPCIDKEIACHPKWIIGMSDCSALLAAWVNSGIMSLHAVQCRHLAEKSGDKSSDFLRQTLFGWLPRYSVNAHPLNRQGCANGTLIGGNLSVLSALIGTPYDIFKPGRILFIEDINEPLYKIERMLYALKLSGVLGSLKALIVGSFEGCKENKDFGGTTYELIRRMVEEYDYPVCFEFPVGHGGECYPLIEGAAVNMKIKTEGVEFAFCP
ncbi:MAG: LD-carboxypeptidase [Bacteroidaceae bacterium]|nr:LD-carboxypeptidase [Bacteroidaceae bacterium]